MLKQTFVFLAVLFLGSSCATRYGVRTPVSSAAVPDLSGTWNSQWGEDYIAVIFMKHEGDRVTGTYTTTARTEEGAGTIEGSLEGRIVGNELRGTWEEGGNRFGRFRFVFTADGKAYEGTWGRKDLEDDGGVWTGNR